MKKIPLVRPCEDTFATEGVIGDPKSLFLFLGEIEQMPGHGVYILYWSEKAPAMVKHIFTALHMDRFEFVPQDDL